METKKQIFEAVSHLPPKLQLRMFWKVFVSMTALLCSEWRLCAASRAPAQATRWTPHSASWTFLVFTTLYKELIAPGALCPVQTISLRLQQWPRWNVWQRQRLAVRCWFGWGLLAHYFLQIHPINMPDDFTLNPAESVQKWKEKTHEI